MRVTLDANILVYALQEADERYGPAQSIVARAIQGECIQTLQSFAECFNALVRKRKLPAGTARAKLDDLRTRLPVATAAPADLDRAIWATMTHRLAFWDAMLWATAERVGCSLLLTEDGHDGRRLEGITFVNPFAPHNRALIDSALPPLEL
jgi:predicted nucleic acid-binding protein